MNTKFVFLILPQLHILDLAGPDQTILEAIDYGAPFSVEYYGIENNINTTSNMPLSKIKHFSKAKLNKGDYLIIPGSKVEYLLSKEFLSNNNQLFSWVRKQHGKGIIICSICAGAFVLAQCGLLDNINCTTHFKRTKQLQQFVPKAKVLENILFTHDNNIYTSAGIASGIDMTLDIIEELQGSYFAHKVARELVIYNRRCGSEQQVSIFLQYRNHIHQGIHQVQDYIVHNINVKSGLNELADIACMSTRNLTRIFKRETGVTIKEYINLVRKETAEELQKNVDLSKKQIANLVGLESERHLSRILK